VPEPRNQPGKEPGRPRIAQLDVELLSRRAPLLRGRFRFDRPFLRRRFAHFLPFRSCTFANFSPRDRTTRPDPSYIITRFPRDGRAAPDARLKIADDRAAFRKKNARKLPIITNIRAVSVKKAKKKRFFARKTQNNFFSR
jgi:hypothetical protein